MTEKTPQEAFYAFIERLHKRLPPTDLKTIWGLRERLQEHLSGLEQRRMEIEMSDDRAYSNGRMAKINDEIAAVRKTLAELEE